jgi:hypothetical protein
LREHSLKELLGVFLYDIWRYEYALRKGSNLREWLELSNRNESLSLAKSGPGVQCNWRWSSELHAPKVFPLWGCRLMNRALENYPINVECTIEPRQSVEEPDVTFIIGHRGIERMPLLQLTLKSIANQQGVNWECIVVEESFEKTIEDKLPSWVKYRHLETESADQPYNRARTFNEGAKLASGRLLVFHDNDMLVPVSYAAELLIQSEAGYQVINLKRFIFYLTQSHTQTVIKSGRISIDSPEFILQNLTGGGSLAVEKSKYFSIGGFDEGFVGWGGEDVEFWDRALTLEVWNYGYLPLIHLWHPPQPEKNPKKVTPAMTRLESRLQIDRETRISQLRLSM